MNSERTKVVADLLLQINPIDLNVVTECKEEERRLRDDIRDRPRYPRGRSFPRDPARAITIPGSGYVIVRQLLSLGDCCPVICEQSIQTRRRSSAVL